MVSAVTPTSVIKSQKITRERSLRAFLAGTLVSRTGEFADLVALNWCVLKITQSPAMLGLLNVIRLAPVLGLTVPAGMLADRCNRRTLLMTSYSITCVTSAVLGFLLITESALWLITSVVAVRAVAGAIEPPVRQAILPALVARHELTKALTLNSACFNLAAVCGPALAAGVAMIADPRWLVWGNAVAYGAVFVTSQFLPGGGHNGGSSPHRPENAGSPDRLAHANDTTSAQTVRCFLRRTPALRAQLMVSIAPMVFVFPYSSLMPLMARDVLHSGASAVGALLACAAAGGLAMSVILTVRPPRVPSRVSVQAAMTTGLLFACFPLTDNILYAIGLMAFIGAFGQLYRTSNRIAIQQCVPENLRGRVVAISLMDRGLIPVGVAGFSFLASLTNTDVMIIAMGAGCLLTTVVIAARIPSKMRNDYPDSVEFLSPLPSQSRSTRFDVTSGVVRSGMKVGK